METTFSELTERPKYYKYGDHPRIKRRSGKRNSENRRIMD
jgi:hypothetical protein